jgi:hypothetical protein
MKMKQTGCSETSAYTIQTPGNYPEENIQHREHGESLKSKVIRKFISSEILKDGANFRDLATDGLTINTSQESKYIRNGNMEGIHLAWSRVQYQAVVNCELVNTDCRKDGEYLGTSVAQN